VKSFPEEVFAARILSEIEVELVDILGNVVSTENDSLVSASSLTEDTGVSGLREVRAVNGIATFKDLILKGE